MDYEAIVVGAGPGGSSAAYHLARLGRRVLLLDRQKFPRDKSCGDGLTRSSVRLLAEMGVLSRLGRVQKVIGVRVLMRGKGSRDFLYPTGSSDADYGMVVPRLRLDSVICQVAVSAGAEFWQEAMVTGLLKTGSLVNGVQVTYNGENRTLQAPVVIAADGASSHLARQAGLLLTPAESFGAAIRGYYSGIENLSDLLEIYTPLLDPTDRYLLPSYGWVFPLESGHANIGVGLFKRIQDTTVRELLARFLDELRRKDPRFANAELEGAWRSAPLRFDFAPERCWVPGLMLVGDAAGTISPFTGEGIGYALESGKIAAETADRSLKTGYHGTLDLSEYAARMSQAYVGYFETGRQSSRRYLLLWHILESTFHNDRPLFALCRQVALFPESLGEPLAPSLVDDVSLWIKEDGIPVRSDLVAVGEILAETVRHDWPFLAHAVVHEIGRIGVPFRPALLLLLCGYLVGSARSELPQAAAAVELGYLAALAQMSVEDESADSVNATDRRPVNWGNMFGLMLGDFLLSKAYELSAQLSAQASKLVSKALANASEGRVRELRTAYNLHLTEAEFLDIQTLQVATLFELPCQLGASVSGAETQLANALMAYGRNLGLAFGIAEDVRGVLDVQPSAPRLMFGGDLRAGIYRLPVLRALQRNGPASDRLRDLLNQPQLSQSDFTETVRLVRESGAMLEAIEVARRFADTARNALSPFPDGSARESLANLAVYVVNRAERSLLHVQTS